MSHGLELSDMERDPKIQVTIDGCDEADADLTLIKGDTFYTHLKKEKIGANSI